MLSNSKLQVVTLKAEGTNLKKLEEKRINIQEQLRRRRDNRTPRINVEVVVSQSSVTRANRAILERLRKLEEKQKA